MKLRCIQKNPETSNGIFKEALASIQTKKDAKLYNKEEPLLKPDEIVVTNAVKS